MESRIEERKCWLFEMPVLGGVSRLVVSFSVSVVLGPVPWQCLGC